MFINEGARTAEFLLSEAKLYRSREEIQITTGSLVAGTILTKTGLAQKGTLAAAAKSGGNTGNGTFTADVTTPVSAHAIPGVYTVRCTVAGTNSATFRLEDPNGSFIQEASLSGSGATAAFTDQIKFTITDGATDFVVGDGFDITVGFGAGANQAETYIAATTAGPADAVLYGAVDASSAATNGTGIVRDAEAHGEFLTFPSGATDAQKRALCESLLRSNIHVRWTSPPVG